jgi:hypothetical protein
MGGRDLIDGEISSYSLNKVHVARQVSGGAVIITIILQSKLYV